MLRIGICDDEEASLDRLAGIVQEALSRRGVRFCVCARPSGDALLTEPGIFDIAFLDIDMPGLGGIRVAEELRTRSLGTKVIFVTGYPNYQAQALGVHAFSYIIKPFDPAQVERELGEAVDQWESQARRPELTLLTPDGGVRRLREEDLLYFESTGRRARAVTAAESFETQSQLRELAKSEALWSFAQPHNSFLVNLLHVRRIRAYEVYLLNGQTVPLSQKRAPEFRARFHEFLQRTFFVL